MTLYSTPQFSVDSHGAYLTRLTDRAGKPILFERTMLGDKRRGGAHVCLPYFGPDGAGVLPQHGFGRDVEWNCEILGDTKIHCVYQEKESESFAGLYASIEYQLKENNFITTLTVKNDGKKAFPVTPGFHPYFAVDPADVRLNGNLLNLVDFEPFKEFPNIPEMTIESRGRVITVSSQDLQDMIVWTDLRGDYLCVEPTLMGNAFDSTKPGHNILKTADMANYSYTISWNTTG